MQAKNEKPVQAFVPAEVKLEVEIQLKREGSTTAEFIRQCFLKKYEEIKKRGG